MGMHLNGVLRYLVMLNFHRSLCYAPTYATMQLNESPQKTTPYIPTLNKYRRRTCSTW